MARRLARDPDALAELARTSASRRGLVRGHIIDVVPRQARLLELPYGLSSLVPQAFGPREVVLARIDVEEAPPVFERPMLERLERGRDFYLADAGGRALVRLGPEVELHLDGEVRTFDLGRGDAGDRTAWVRVLRAGEEVVVAGRFTVEEDAAGLAGAGFRESPRLVVFRGSATPFEPLHVYDQPAFAQAVAWDRLSWLGKLAVLLRSPSR